MSTELKKSDFNFELPEELIAQTPLEKRDSSRLLAINKASGSMEDRCFSDILEYLNEGDCLVINDTKVLPARLRGNKDETGAAVELLLLKDHGGDVWECIVFPGKKLREGAKVTFGEGLLRAEITEVLPDGNRLAKFFYDGIFLEILEQLGKMPLPHYIKEQLEDKNRYQTIYAKHSGSAAAPTAGLHFTDELMKRVLEKGVKIARVTLHVGLGTFRPVKVDNITEHHMHSESYEVSEQVAEIINNTKKQGGKIIAVGTTSCRTLESATDENGVLMAKKGETDIFIYPGYKFKSIDGLITNFHLPESTLMMLISAFATKDLIMEAYSHAIAEKYRFFSFGDAMLICDWDKK